MEQVKVMIVDDSSFSRTILKGIMEECGFEVVGESDCFCQLIETYDKTKPDIVTMDIAMPGKDGFDCSKELLLHDKKAKVLLISSMKDEETELKAKHVGALGYLQKPVEVEDVKNMVTKILSPDVLFDNLSAWGLEAFKEALSQNITKLTKSTVELLDRECINKNISQGYTVILGAIGMYSGKIVLNLSSSTAEKMTELILKRPAKDSDEVLAMVAEFANIVGGIAFSMLNKQDKALSLRVTPPSVFYGKSAEVTHPNVSMKSIDAKTEFGDIELSFGFQKGSKLWM